MAELDGEELNGGGGSELVGCLDEGGEILGCQFGSKAMDAGGFNDDKACAARCHTTVPGDAFRGDDGTALEHRGDDDSVAEGGFADVECGEEIGVRLVHSDHPILYRLRAIARKLW